ncbi:RNA polymerase sigma factor [Mesorhizobium sp. SB112]|uniref:RNA polymerase sigma factor n=1 Tax=Mesorhizobium sp. SB112 TaxID=3151853 RepID=UPI0032675AC1
MRDLQRLFVRHAHEVKRSLLRLGHNAETAADLTQDTFVRVMTAAHVGDLENPRAYLHRVARNLSFDLRRRDSRVEFLDLNCEEAQRAADTTPLQDTVLHDRQRIALLETALLELPEKTRRAFVLHRMGEMTLQQVADELQLSTSRTWNLVQKAYLHIRRKLNEIGE